MYTVVIAFSTMSTIRARVAPSELSETIRMAWDMGATAIQAELDVAV